MLIALAILVVQTRDTIERYFEGVGTLEVREVPERDTVYLTWRGAIDAPMASRVAEAFERHNGAGRTFVLSISSLGGSLDHGAQVARLLRRIGQTHTLETVVDEGRRCASMCVPIYLQGRRRTAAASARFMFHEVSFRDFHSNDELDVPERAKASATDQLFRQYFASAGVPQAWIAQVREDMAGGRDVWKTAAELVEEGAGIVQELF